VALERQREQRDAGGAPVCSGHSRRLAWTLLLRISQSLYSMLQLEMVNTYNKFRQWAMP
jgi:hypothetical protein